MPTVRPFTGWLVSPDRVHDVVAPAYDALSPAQRHRYAQAHPQNYVNAMRSLEEFPPHERPSLDQLLQRNRANLERLLEQGAFRRSDAPCLYIYRLRADGHEQTGLVGEVPVEEYDRGIIKKHEHTHTSREDQLARYNDVVGAASSPVCLTYEHHPGIDAIVARHTAGTPLIDFVADDGVAQSVWCIDDPGEQALLGEYFAQVGEAYLTDGHHRAAAGSRFAHMRRRRNPRHTGEEAYNFLLVVLFPDDQLRILPYNRCVTDTGGLGVEDLLQAMPEEIAVERLGPVPAEAAAPERPLEFAMLVDDQWFRLRVDPDSVPVDDPVGALDVTILQERILGPILGIADVRCDERCQCVAGAVGMEGLAERCREAGGVAFACHPVSIQQLMAVADAGLVMPPKSTWFDPKVRSGLFLRLR
ncbi:MAG TPA: DUF1015 domain-containing protein [Arenicellales bacterium]|nr:DUF1015 domain-containing protein [Arenicellales bacterium]